MSRILMGPTGQILKGHVLDCSVSGITRALQDYDKQLYVRWNPKKLKGWGCWEIRRRPEEKSAKDVEVFDGNTYVVVDYVENDLVHHILDCAFLNYDAVRKVKSMDTWQAGHWMNDLEYIESENNRRAYEKAASERRYNIKQMRGLASQFKEMVASGLNPAHIADHWGSMP